MDPGVYPRGELPEIGLIFAAKVRNNRGAKDVLMLRQYHKHLLILRCLEMLFVT